MLHVYFLTFKNKRNIYCFKIFVNIIGAERSNAARQVGGTGVGDGANDKDRDRNSTLGALKATQRATGKAFVLHKY